MEGHLNREYKMMELEPGMPEETRDKRVKTSPRMQGTMRMALRRVARNPENSRLYVVGDPVPLIDWKAYARTDELIVREQRDEASATVMILVDISDTMMWPPQDAKLGVEPKASLALRVALYLAHAHLAFGDSVEVWFRKGGPSPTLRWMPRSPGEVLAVFHASRNNLAERILDFCVEYPFTVRRFDVAWVVSDCLDKMDTAELFRMARVTKLVHTISARENALDWMDDETCYIEREPVRRDYLGKQLKSGSVFREKLEAWSETWRQELRNIQGGYILIHDETPVGLFFHWLLSGA